ncbi:MAG: hypothetical protein F6K09_14245 [Merismopedia sp. SIO2A8]|nr:hypothetical protein [Merismopedia sp. SIO2A8]
MDRSPLSLTNDVCFCVSGTVTIHPTAAIATNVVLHANPGSRIIIGAGVVVGRGTILHADGGTLNIDSKVVLGTKVLLFGCGTIGKNACIGSMTTIMAAINVPPDQVIPPNSLVGIPEPILQPSSAPSSSPTTEPESEPTSKSTDSPSVQSDDPQYNENGHHRTKYNSEQNTHIPARGKLVEDGSASGNNGNASGERNGTATETNAPTLDMEKNAVTNSATSKKAVVYGQASVQRLITMMFPHRSLNNNGEDKE